MDLELYTCGVGEILDHVGSAQKQGAPFDAVISLEDPDARPSRRAPRLAERLGSEWKGRQLILQCFDIDYSRMGEPVPGPAIIADTIKFVEGLPLRDGKLKLITQCSGGFGRSPALGFVLLCYARGPGMEMECLDEILRLNPAAMPNEPIVAHGDKFLQREGRMIRIFETPRIKHNRALKVAFG
jgi:predicted protein tyrosine phosphatase